MLTSGKVSRVHEILSYHASHPLCGGQPQIRKDNSHSTNKLYSTREEAGRKMMVQHHHWECVCESSSLKICSGLYFDKRASSLPKWLASSPFLITRQRLHACKLMDEVSMLRRVPAPSFRWNPSKAQASLIPPHMGSEESHTKFDSTKHTRKSTTN